MALFDTIRFFNAGYCRQLRYLAEGYGRGTTRFYAVFVYLKHPVHGALLIDTGYSEAFMEATRPFPHRLYRWLTPVRLPPARDAAQVLRTHGVDPESIDTIFISHFHGDHIGGLRAFSRTRFVYLQDAYDALCALGSWAQVRHAFLSALLPDDFAARSTGVALDAFEEGQGALAGLRVFDFFRDGSLLCVDLPGHAYGHLGFVLNVAPRPVLYVVDACWNIEILTHQRHLPRLSRRVQYDYAAYRASLEALQKVQQRDAYHLLACHCPHTQAYVENAEG